LFNDRVASEGGYELAYDATHFKIAFEEHGFGIFDEETADVGYVDAGIVPRIERHDHGIDEDVQHGDQCEERNYGHADVAAEDDRFRPVEELAETA
jgi:hypothetical protein